MGLLRATDRPVSAEAFIAWREEDGGGGRHELFDGEIVAMAPERVVRARVKACVYRELRRAIETAALPCEAFADGMAVRVDDDTVLEPDALVHCGARLSNDVVLVVDPIIVVEVASPSTQRLDALVKFQKYFSNAAIRHYVIVVPTGATVIHHARHPDGHIETSGQAERLRLDPPGLDLDVAAFFETIGD